MNLSNKRIRFYHWLRKDVFKVPEATIGPRFLPIIYYLLFPLNWFYEKQSGIKYDMQRHIYIIQGMEFSGGIFEFLTDVSKTGKTFKLKSTDGKTAIIEELN